MSIFDQMALRTPHGLADSAFRQNVKRPDATRRVRRLTHPPTGLTSRTPSGTTSPLAAPVDVTSRCTLARGHEGVTNEESA